MENVVWVSWLCVFHKPRAFLQCTTATAATRLCGCIKLVFTIHVRVPAVGQARRRILLLYACVWVCVCVYVFTDMFRMPLLYVDVVLCLFCVIAMDGGEREVYRFIERVYCAELLFDVCMWVYVLSSVCSHNKLQQLQHGPAEDDKYNVIV